MALPVTVVIPNRICILRAPSSCSLMLSSSSDDILIQRFASQQFVRCLSAYGVHRQQKDNSHHGGTTMVMMIRTIVSTDLRKPGKIILFYIYQSL